MKCYILLVKANKKTQTVTLETALSAHLFHLIRTQDKEEQEPLPEKYKDVVQWDVILHDTDDEEALTDLKASVERCLIFDSADDEQHTFIISYIDLTPSLEEEVIFLSKLGEEHDNFIVHVYDNHTNQYTDYLNKNRHIAVHYKENTIPAMQISENIPKLTFDQQGLLAVAQFNHFFNTNSVLAETDNFKDTVLRIADNYDVWSRKDRSRVYKNNLLPFYLIDYIGFYENQSAVWPSVFNNMCADNFFSGVDNILNTLTNVFNGKDENFLSEKSLSDFFSVQDWLQKVLHNDVLVSLQLGSLCAGRFAGALFVNLDPYNFSSIKPETEKRMVERQAKFTVFYSCQNSDESSHCQIVVRRLDENDDCRHVVQAIQRLAGTNDITEEGDMYGAWCILSANQWSTVQQQLQITSRISNSMTDKE